MWIGLCGQSGAGKGYVAAMFAKKGIPSIDTDGVYRDLTAPEPSLSPCMAALCDAFGKETALPDGSLNRTYLRTQVFGKENSEKRALLNRITHQFILAETEKRAASLCANGAHFVLIDAPLLYESGIYKKCAAVICVTAPLAVRLARIEKRDGITEEAAMARIRIQIDEDTLRARADYVIVNDGDAESLDAQVTDVMNALRKRFPDTHNRLE